MERPVDDSWLTAVNSCCATSLENNGWWRGVRVKYSVEVTVKWSCRKTEMEMTSGIINNNSSTRCWVLVRILVLCDNCLDLLDYSPASRYVCYRNIAIKLQLISYSLRLTRTDYESHQLRHRRLLTTTLTSCLWTSAAGHNASVTTSVMMSATVVIRRRGRLTTRIRTSAGCKEDHNLPPKNTCHRRRSPTSPSSKCPATAYWSDCQRTTPVIARHGHDQGLRLED